MIYKGSYRAGSLIAIDHPYKIDTTITGETVIHDPDYNEWSKHFNKYVFAHKYRDIPRPCMYMGKPHWYGGLDPVEGEYYGEEKVWIGDMMCDLKLVYLSSIAEPTTKEYVRYFKFFIEKGVYVIVTRQKDGTTRIAKRKPIKQEAKT